MREGSACGIPVPTDKEDGETTTKIRTFPDFCKPLHQETPSFLLVCPQSVSIFPAICI